MRASLVAATVSLAISISVGTKSVLPLLLFLGAASLLVFRTARNSTWKSSDFITRWLYAVHSHLQHIPIAAGQASFAWNSIRSRRRSLIEYKG